MHLLNHRPLRRRIRSLLRRPIGTADALDLEAGLARVLVLVHDVVHRLVALAEVAQAVIAADGAMGDAARNQHHIAGRHFVDAEFGFHLAAAAKLEIDHVRVDVAVEAILNTDDALDTDAVIFVVEDHQRLIGDAEHIKGAESRRVMGAFRRAHQTGLAALRPSREPWSGKVLPGGHELADLLLFVDLFFRRFGFWSPIHDSSVRDD